MIALLIAIFCLFVLITIRDVRYRLVYGEDLLLLVSLRIFAAALSLYPDEFGLQAHQWGFAPLGVSILVSCIAASLFWALGQLVSKVSCNASLGGGDVLLLAACCLFVDLGNLDSYVLLVALMGIALALVWLFAKKSKTFPFAPALVWPCWLLLVL